ncbi:OmpH family outer membrane protein [Flavobacteriaceae bacterium F89]|uniref:OmpH family outer membrane protein n=1 Tax=Cerina litoralis TaxID=2874477 RepID=A0AAE3JPK0_9FLAO|nr:OmpH family outer membrane protein [Cerina litoralis]MCG2459208.1 OmpH family outer membrane protein [Cerina litoralis]
MKKVIMSFALFGVMACQQNKIGFVDNVKLMKEYQEQIDIQAKFKTKADALTKQRDSISQAFQAEAQAFQAKASSMSQKEAQEQYGQFQQRGQRIGQQLQQQEQELQMGSQVEMDSLISKVKKEIASYGIANGYTYILGGGEGGSVLYGDSAKDLTAEILKLLNDKYKK